MTCEEHPLECACVEVGELEGKLSEQEGSRKALDEKNTAMAVGSFSVPIVRA